MLLLELDADCLVFHMGMTGQLTFWDKTRDDGRFYRQPTTGLQRVRQHRPDRHTHLSLWFTDGNAVHFRDIRKFGSVRLVRRSQLAALDVLQRLGPEPLGPEFHFKPFRRALRRTRRAIKAVLLDQQVVAGLGNIYADEALFAAGLRPFWQANNLSHDETQRLFEAIPVVLEKGIHFGGTSLRDYIDSDGARGSNQEELLVYGRGGEPCRVCGTPIQRIVLAQRSTHYCPSCQRRPRRGSA
jgi:formamidopyrimidine-DNA glycosylase